MNAPTGPGHPPSPRDRRTAWLLVLGQFGLLGLIVLLPGGDAWTLPVAVVRVALGAALVAIILMLVAASALGRGLTATPLPNAHAELRTGGLYRFVRHPIYSGLLLFAVARTLPSGDLWTALACVALVVLINAKAHWEERHLAQRFPGYAAYAAGTPRFIPGLARYGMAESDPHVGLPLWRSVLAVVAHPDDESFGLGAVLSTFADAGATVTVLCFTHGEASTLHGVSGDLTTVRAGELEAAAAVLGASSVTLLDYSDGALTDVDLDELAGHVIGFAGRVQADGLVAFDLDGVTGHADHTRATAAGLRAGGTLGLEVLGWTLPAETAEQLVAEHEATFTGHESTAIDIIVTVDRTRQLAATAEHRSQALPGSVLWRRLELLGDREHLRWLR